MTMLPLTKRQLNTVLAALRYWQEYTTQVDRGNDEIATDGLPTYIGALNDDEIDILCQRLNHTEDSHA